MIVKVVKGNRPSVSLAEMGYGYHEVKNSWSNDYPDNQFAGRVIYKSPKGQLFWEDNKEVVVPGDIREGRFEKLQPGDVIYKEMTDGD